MNFTLRLKLLSMTLIPIVALIIVSTYAYFQVSRVNNEVKEIAAAEIQLIDQALGEQTSNIADASRQAILHDEIVHSVSDAQALEETALINIVIFGLITILMGIFLNFAISHRIFGLLKKALTAAKHIGQSECNLSHNEISNDELGELIHTLLDTQTKVLSAESALRSSEDQIRLITDSIPAMICYIDRSEVYQFCNYHYALSFDRMKDDIINHAVKDVVGDDIYREISPMIKKVFDGELVNFSFSVKTKNQKNKYVNARYTPHFDRAGKVQGFFSIIQDITEQELAKIELEEQRVELERLSQTDALTGVYNRRSLVSTLEAQIERHKRYATPLSVIMLDLDHFKRINDNYGHASGDDVLRIVSKILKQHVRETDFVCRYGGEEFSIILSDTGIDEGVALAERLRHIIEEAHIPISENERIDFTCSIGIAEYDKSIRNSDTLIAVADEALYKAKRQGRNKVVLAKKLSAVA